MPKLKELDNTDDLYNPSLQRAGSLLTREQSAGEDSNNGTATNLPTDDAANATKNIDDLNEKESGSGEIPNQFSYASSGKASSGKESKGRRFINLRGPLKKKGPLAVIIALLLLAAGGPIALLPLGPIMFVENIVRDLNDQVQAMDDRFLWMARNKIPKADREKALKGCGTVVTIRCKFATIGSKQIEKLKYAGITVEGNKSLIPGRTVPETYTFRGEKFTATQWGDLLNGKNVTKDGKVTFKRGSSMHTAAMRSQRIANNARYSSVSDKSFLNRVYKRFGISKKPPELKGRTKAERVNALLNKANTASIGDLTFTPIEEDGKVTGYTLDGCNSGCRTYTPDEYTKMKKSIDAIKVAKPPSTLKTLGIGALSVTGYWDLACTVSNTLKAATVAAKVSNLAQSIEYTAPVFASIQKIKSGDGTYEDGQAVGEFFGDADNRKTISDIAALADIKGDVDAGNISSLGDIEIPEGANPNYGKNALDSELYKMSSNNGTIAPMTDTRTQFSLGYSQNSLLAYSNGASSLIQDVVNVGSTDACNVIQSWWMRGIGLIGGVALIATGVGAGAQAAKAVAVVAAGAAALFGLNAILNKALSNDLVKESDLENDTVARGELAWTGAAGMFQEGAKARGMVPANADEITAYNFSQNSTNVAYDDLERSQVKNQLDIKNEFSFMGTLSRTFLNSTSKTSSLFASLGLVEEGLSTLTTSAYAAPINADRFKQCDDSDYKKLGIDADVQCNVRYFMPEKDLELDTDFVAQWMEEQSCGGDGPCVNAETGLPEGYTPPDPTGAQKGAMATLQGVGSGILDSFTPESYPNDYAKYLQFCAYRIMPYGDTGEDGDKVGDGWDDGSKCRDTNDQQMSYFRIYTLDKTIQEAEDDEGIENTGAANDGGAAGDTSLRVATFNVGGDATANNDMIDKMTAALKSKKADVVGFQEFNAPWRTAALDSSKTGMNYASYPKTAEYGGGGSPSINSILYNTDRFEVVDGGTMPNLKYFNNNPLNAPYVLLRDKTSGQEFYVLNTHDPADGKNFNEATKQLHKRLRYENAKEHVKFINSLDKEIPVIFTGDFNSGYSLRTSGGNQTYGNDPNNLAYCILTKGTSLNDAYDVVTNRAKKCPNPGNDNTVDHVFLSDGITASNYQSGYGGDVHQSRYFDIVIQGSGVGDTAWPLDKKWWTTNRSDFLDPHNGAGTFTSPNTDGIAADIGVPKGTPVYAMVGGTVIKRPLGRSSYICTGSPNSNNNGGLMIQSKVDGGTLLIAYAHGDNVISNNSVQTGQQIMTIGQVGNSCGAHLHIDMSYDGHNVCPQDVFFALSRGETIDWQELAASAEAPCRAS